MTEVENKIKNSPEVPSDSDLFVGEVHRNLSEREVFVGDEDFYRLLANSTPTVPIRSSANAKRSLRGSIHRNRFSGVQKAFVAGIITIGAMLLYVVLKPLLWSPNKISTPTTQEISPSTLPAADSIQVVQEPVQQSAPLFPSKQPLSLDVARELYLQNDYGQAYAAYNQLLQSLPSGERQELLRDFLQFKMALCLNKAGNSEQANSLFRTLSQSRSPVIRVVANYELSLLQIQKKQYIQARTMAYQAIAMVSVVDFDKDWILSLQRDCQFLIAESMTRNVLLLCDADEDVQSMLWSSPVAIDPFINLDETQLRSLLNSGLEQLKQGLLSPQIRKLEHQGVLPRWSVIAYGASVEELLSRFVANAGFDISWIQNKMPDTELVGNAVRKRPVSLYLSSATARQAIEVAAGHVGLLSCIDEKGILAIHNPADYSSLSEYVNLLTQDAVSLWRNILLTFHDDKRVPNAHFALGLLHTQEGRPASAIAEYKLVANQFSQTSLAPYALLSSSKLKAQLHDYPGAREDLTQLVEQYPETEIYGQACLNLADATKNAGFFNEALRLYRKVNNLGLSSELQTVSALGAGRCSYEIRDYENAAKWLVKYIKLANDPTDEGYYSAYFLLGKVNLALGSYQQASLAFQYALSGPVGSLARERYVETVSLLVETHIQLEKFVEALTLLETIDSWQFSTKESIEILLLKSKVLRLMGLPDKAIAVLGNNAEYLPDSQLKTRMFFELANSYIAKGDLNFAHKKLTDILISAAPGHLSNEIALRLAEVCLDLGQSSQTITVCKQLLDSEVSIQIRQKALKVQAAAYNQQKNFDNAALALLGQR
ncbi:MAG: tetratricopeptide repeat protein [Planctomycetes bacterium]|nr:tetratricopeptide repeat protein [Planctomycetota bacterium]MBL7143509.1 tetratricopeptide repeat protein [Phycisphaerae bacterium]